VSFDAFIGADWSGARGPNLPGVQIAECLAGTAAPVIIGNPVGGPWTRVAFADWLGARLLDGRRYLIGIDFSFSFPYTDLGAFFPGAEASPRDMFGLWRFVEDRCEDGDGFYSRAFARHEDTAPYFLTRSHRGERYAPRLRSTDRRCAELGLGTPDTMFKLIGPKQVGLGSLSGMRVIQKLRELPGALSVWPVEGRNARSVCVDIFSRAFLRRATRTNRKVGSIDDLNTVLTFYESAPITSHGLNGDSQLGDKADAAVAAAALRALSLENEHWQPAGLSDAVRHTEGWIFGVS
jgi:hypothetical protein